MCGDGQSWRPFGARSVGCQVSMVTEISRNGLTAVTCGDDILDPAAHHRTTQQNRRGRSGGPGDTTWPGELPSRGGQAPVGQESNEQEWPATFRRARRTVRKVTLKSRLHRHLQPRGLSSAALGIGGFSGPRPPVAARPGLPGRWRSYCASDCAGTTYPAPQVRSRSAGAAASRSSRALLLSVVPFCGMLSSAWRTGRSMWMTDVQR